MAARKPKRKSWFYFGMKSATDSPAQGIAREALLCFVAFFTIFFLTHCGHDNSEGWYHYMVAKQILTAHTLGFPEPQQGVFTVAPNGWTYASHEIGNTLFMLPLVWFNGQLERHLGPRIGETRMRFLWRFLFASLSPVYAAAGLALIFTLLRVFFDQTLRVALVNVLTLGFCSFYWSYSRSLYDGMLCCVLLCAATLLLFLYSRTWDGKWLILAFCCWGFGFITRLTMIIPIGAAFLYLGLILRSDWKRWARASLTAAAVLLPFAAWQGYYNHLRTGNALVSAVQTYQGINDLTGDLLTHVPGLLMSPGKGILIYAPPVLLALFCFPSFFRRYPAEALYIEAIGLAWLLVHAKLATNWYGAWGWGPRHFITITPLMAVPFLVSGANVFRSTARIVFARLCLAFGFFLAAASLIGDWLYRLEFAAAEGRLDDRHMLWSLTQNQAVDMILSSGRNLARLFVRVPFDVVPGASATNQRAGNTVNVWLVTAYHEGVPTIAVTLAAILLVSLVIWSFWLLLRSPQTADQPGVTAR